MLCVQALASVDIGSLICNVGAGGGAAPAAAVAAAPAGDAPGNTHTLSDASHLHYDLIHTLKPSSVCITAKVEEKKEEKKEESEESDDDMGFGLFD